MPDNLTTALVKTAQSPALARVSNQLALTDKLLTKLEEPFLIPYRKGDKWGFCDRNKNIVIDCVYEKVDPFSEGLALVWIRQGSDENEFGYINYLGEFVIREIIYVGHAESFSDGLALIGFPYCIGYIDKNSTTVIPLQYNQAYSFSEGLAAVEINSELGFGFIDRLGNMIVQPQYSHAYSFSESLALVRKSETNDWHFIGKEDNKVLSIRYIRAESFINGLSLVQSQDQKFGFINRKGEEVIPLIYDQAHDFIDSLAAVRLGKEWKYINKDGDIIFTTKYDFVHSFSEGIAAVEWGKDWGNDRCGFINKLGEEIIPLQYTSPYSGKPGPPFAFSKGLVWVGKGYLDKRGVEYWEG